MKYFLKQTAVFKNNFDITDENDQLVYTVKGNVGGLVGLRSSICSADGETELVTIKQRFSQYKFDIKQNEYIVATVKKQWLSVKGKYIIEGLDWEMVGSSFIKHEYSIVNRNGDPIATLYKQGLTLNDKFAVDIIDSTENPALIFAVILALDAIIDQVSR